MKPMFRKFGILCLSLVLLLSGCSAIGLDVETQLTPPESSEEQKAIRTALDEYINTHTAAGESVEYTLKYPSGGRYLSAFVLLDQVQKHTLLTPTAKATSADAVFDSAGKEALAFYRRNDETALVHINLLRCGEDGVWSSVADVEGMGESVNQVEFADLNNDGVPELLIGWSLYNSKDSRLSVYNIDENLAVRTFSAAYTELVVADVTADGADDLLLLSIAGSADLVSAQLFSFRTNNEIVSGNVMLDSDIVSFGDHITAALSDDCNGVFIDCYKEQDAMITELLCWQDDKLVAPLCDQSTLLNTQTAREMPIASRDIDGDGMVEWPITTRMPGFEETALNNTLWYTEWRSYSVATDEIHTEFSGLIPAEDGYMLRLRDEWNALPAAYSIATRTLTLYQGSDSDQWLFRILTVPSGEKDALPDGYVLLEEQNTVCYAVCIAEDTEMVTLEEIRYLLNVLEEDAE